MTDRAIPHGFAAAFVALPFIGLLCFSVPWETDPRIEKPEVRYQRLKNPYGAFLVGIAGRLGGGHFNESYEFVPDWDGLFPWEEKDLAALTHQLEQNSATGREDRIDDYSVDYRETPPSPEGLGRIGQRPPEGVDAVDEILRTGRNPNKIRLTDGTTPLSAMVAIRDLERTKALLSRGANPNLKDGNGVRPLRILIEQCKTGIALRQLQSCKAHYGTTSPTMCEAQEKECQISQAEDEKLLPLFEILIAGGAAVTRRIPGDALVVNGVSESSKDVSTLEYARMSCSALIVKALSAARAAAAK